ncbi:MAG: LptF/LptG family permease [Phycisphaeraceae bacterium]|nr:MAG: LptF/LptG family permease [Phycisphaeraceae bacterium]
MLRAPTMLWRLLLSELWRILILSAAAVVTVIAFAATVLPLASGELGPLTAIKFMLLAIPPMLQFALPFAAGFAATLAYHRFATDNEALAASAGGVSHRAKLLPAAATGLVLAIALAALTNLVIPRFFRAMEMLISRDAASLIAGAIQRGESVDIAGMLVRADEALRLGPDPASGAIDRLVLKGVLAITTDSEGDITTDVIAERADVWLFSRRDGAEDTTIVSMRLRGASWWHEDEYGDHGELDPRPIAFRHGVSSRVKYLTFFELRELLRNPDEHPHVDGARRRLAAQVSSWLALNEIHAALGVEARLSLTRGETDSLTLRASGIEPDGERWRLAPDESTGKIELHVRQEDGVRRRHVADGGWLTLQVDETEGVTRLGVNLQNVVTPEAAESRRASLEYSGLRLNNDPSPSVFQRSSQELVDSIEPVERAGAGEDSIGRMRDAAHQIQRQNDRLYRQVIARHHERFGLSVACLVMTLTGAVMALRLREGAPLVVYLWSFFPALASVITISGGKSLATGSLALGLFIVWAGVAGLALYTLIVYLDKRRH